MYTYNFFYSWGDTPSNCAGMVFMNNSCSSWESCYDLYLIIGLDLSKFELPIYSVLSFKNGRLGEHLIFDSQCAKFSKKNGTFWSIFDAKITKNGKICATSSNFIPLSDTKTLISLKNWVTLESPIFETQNWVNGQPKFAKIKSHCQINTITRFPRSNYVNWVTFVFEYLF